MLQRTKIILSIIIIVLAIAGLVILLVIFRRPVTRDAVTNASGPSPVDIRVNEQVSAILNGASSNTCDLVGSQLAKDRCYIKVALSRAELGLCYEIKDQNLEAACVGEIIAAQVASGADPKDCLTIKEKTSRGSCILAAVDQGADESFCNELSEDEKSLCLDRAHLLVGLTGDEEACATIVSKGLREECFSAAAYPSVPEPLSLPLTDSDKDGLMDDEEKILGTDSLKIDSDGDGLSDFDEVKSYETDPLKIDTDNDGYADDAELKAGYNPRGPGRL